MKNLIDCTLYLIALINPISKLFILSVLLKDAKPREIRNISIRASVIAILILFLIAVAGNVILTRVFHVELYSLKIAGGIILFIIGLNALTKGIFFEIDKKTKLEDVSIVPLASPMIAGPGTITAVISFSAEYGFYLTTNAMILAVCINLLIMLSSKFISEFLHKYHLMEALIRITGLIVATIAVQMTLTGITNWYHNLK